MFLIMPWGWRWGRRGRWPGHGPFSHLPPWERPGWIYRGRGGWCWRYAYYQEIEYEKRLEERIENLEKKIEEFEKKISEYKKE